ncbi:MAG: glycosyltransferase [Planctomycetales bacterium]|nr:glycosyltransferase [Planctomycetales bacterium]
MDDQETAADSPESHFTPSISLVMPAWNEKDSLPRAVAEADAALRSLTTDYEIIIVDDGSCDGTADCVEQLAVLQTSVRLVRHDRNRGYGAALRSGFEAARCDLVAFTDADAQFDLREMKRFVRLAEDYDVVCGYRIDRQDPPLRRFYSLVYNQLVRAFFRTSVRDIDCAFKVFCGAAPGLLSITTDGFLVNTELLTQAREHNLSVVEVGVSHRPRTTGQSTVSIFHIPIVLAGLTRFWWNHVQFPADATVLRRQQLTSPGEARFAWAQVVFVMLVAALLLSGLSYPLIDRDETRYAEIPREMVETGNWLVPQLNFRTYYDKPVLMYWACAASYRAFGISESSARAVPVFCGLITLITSMWFANRILGNRAGLLAGIVLFLSVGFLGGSRMLLIDGLLTCCVTVSLVCASEAVRLGRLLWSWWVASAVACGLGFLAKGPIAVVLVVPPVVAYTWLSARVDRPRSWHWLLWCACMALIATPWFVAVQYSVPDFAYQFFYRHNVERFGGAFHAQPFWFFIPVVLLGGHPWSFLAIPCFHFLTTPHKSIRAERVPELGFLALWIVWCLAFFSVSKCKLSPYILPAAPAMSLLVARYLQHVFWSGERGQWTRFAGQVAPWLAAGATCLAGIGFAAFGLARGFETLLLGSMIIAICVVMLIGIVVCRQYLNRPLAAWSLCAALTFAVNMTILYHEIPRYARAESVFGSGSSPLAEIEPRTPVVTVGHEWSGIPFSLRRNDIHNVAGQAMATSLAPYMRDDQPVLIVVRRSVDLASLRTEIPSSWILKEVAQRGPARLLLVTSPPKTARLVPPIETNARAH